MDTCENPFMIWFTGRTGSTYLCDLLDSHPQVRCRKEQFCEVRLPDGVEVPFGTRTFSSNAGVFRRRLFADGEIIDDPDDERTIAYLHSIFDDDARACGFKLKFPNQAMCYPEIVQYLKTIDGLKIVELVRGNVLKQAISLRNVARIQELGVSKASNAVEDVKLRPLDLDVELAKKHAVYFLRSRDKFYDFTKQFDDVLAVRYEQLLEDGPGTLQKLQQFLKVDLDVQLRSQFKKTTPDRISDAISNYDELVAAVQGTELECFLD